MIIVVAIVFIVTLFLGIPLAFVLGMTGMTHLFTLGNPAFINVAIQRLFMGINNITLSCLPFFIIAGQIMNVGGITKKLMNFSRDCVGYVKGGLAYTTVIVAMILSAIIGAAQAVATILCTVLLPEMKSDGYKEEYSGSLIAAAGVLGPIIPPSVVFVAYSVRADVSVKGLFMGGIVPGILIGLGYAIIIFIQSRHPDFPKTTGTFSFKKMITSFITAIPALLIPTIIVGGIMGGVFTPTESGAVAVVAAILVGLLYGTLDLRKLPKIFLDAGIVSAGILFIISFGNVIGWTMVMDGIPQKVMDGIYMLTSNPSIILFLMLTTLVIVGCIMDITAAMLIFIPVMSPLARSIGLDPIHWGVIFCITLTIGFITPPVGQVLFVTANVSSVPYSSLCKHILPFCVVAIIIVIALAYLPDVVMWLPRIFM